MNFPQFYIAGINYKKTNASLRGLFAIDQPSYEKILQNAAHIPIQELFILSTCNRTEIYGIAADADVLIELLCKQCKADIQTFHEICYVKQGFEAVQHLFQVAAGLDSQLLGDYEIVGQLKKAVLFAKQHKCIGTFLERLTNFALQASKTIKSQTRLSSGTVSVAFAAMQFIKENERNIQNKKILLIGTGKIGKNTCKNLVDYLNTTNITLINRTGEKAETLAKELFLQTASYQHLETEIHAADIILVATHAASPVILKKHLLSTSSKILIDLSIPHNIEPAVKELPNILLANVDDLSHINDTTLKTRQAEVPKAKEIIATFMEEFISWYRMRKNVPLIKAVKQKLMDMQQTSFIAGATYNADVIQQTVNNMAVKMRTHHQPGCSYIQAINDFLTSHSN